jgi:hypothetical protein
MDQAIAAYKRTSDFAKNTSEVHKALDTVRREDDATGEDDRKGSKD